MIIDSKKYDKHYFEKNFFKKLKKIIKLLSTKTLKQIITLYVLLKSDNVQLYVKAMIIIFLSMLILMVSFSCAGIHVSTEEGGDAKEEIKDVKG